MKKIIYLFVSFFTVLSLSSCKRLSDSDGNLLNDLDANQGGLTGERFLYTETSSTELVAKYLYSGRKLMRVLGDSAITDITYNGDLVNKIEYRGLVNGDSTSYTQFFTYDPNTPLVTLISESRSFYQKLHKPNPPAVKKTKAVYAMTYDASKKLSNITMKAGQEIPTQTFSYTNYDTSDFTYDANKNVTKVIKKMGAISSTGTLSNPSSQFTLDFLEYDQMKNPFRLVSYEYNLHKTIEDVSKCIRFSTNNPKKIVKTQPLSPGPVTQTSQYSYDAQGYALQGFGISYDYRAF